MVKSPPLSLPFEILTPLILDVKSLTDTNLALSGSNCDHKISFIACGQTLFPLSSMLLNMFWHAKKRDLIVFQFVVLQMCMPSILYGLQTYAIVLPEAS